MRKYLLAFIGAMLIILAGCQAGMSQQERLDAFQADIEAGADASGHFRGPGADTIDENTFLSTALTPSNNVMFYSPDVIASDSFTSTYNTTGGDDQASGGFVNEGTNGLGGDDWYISSITINENVVAGATEIIP